MAAGFMLPSPHPSKILGEAEATTVFSILLVVALVALVWYATHREPARPTPPRHLAPEGTFFLLTYLSVPTPKGIIGFEPGREVILVEVHEKNGSLLVTDGQYKVEAKPAQLTNDLDSATLARNQDERSQQMVTAYLTSERDKFLKAQQQVDAEHSSRMDKCNEQMTRSSAIG